MPRIRNGIIGAVCIIAIGCIFAREVRAEAACSVSSSGSLSPNSSGSVIVQVTNSGTATLQWVYIYKADPSPFTGGSADGWSVASSDESRMEFTGGSIETGAATSYSLTISAGAEPGSIGFIIQASESADGSNRIECGSISVDSIEASSASTPTPTPTSTSSTTTVTTVITATPHPTNRPTPTPIPDRTGPTIRVSTDVSKPFTVSPEIEGSISDASGVSSVSYSVDGGKNYIPVDAVIGTAVKAFTFTPQVTLDDDYAIVIRGIDGAGNVATHAVGTLIIDRMPPRIGAVLISLGSIVIDEKHGRIPLIAGVPYRITVSAVGGPTSMLVKANGYLDEAALVKNTDTGLWEGALVLRAPSDTTLSILARDGANNVVTSDVAALHGIVSGIVSDDHAPLSDVRVRVFVKNTKGIFTPWNGAEYGEVLQSVTDNKGMYASMLPSGTYYVEYEKNGYVTVKTRIFVFEKASVISADVHMRPRRGFWIWNTWFIPLFDIATQTIDIRSIEEAAGGSDGSSVHVGETLSYVPFVYNGSPISYLSFRGKPTLITFLTSWSPTAIGQLGVINRLATNTNIHVVGVFSQQTDSSIAVIAKRGVYRATLVADPDGIASEAVSLHTVPLHVVMDRFGVIRNIYTGFMSEEALKDALIRQ